MYRIHSFTFEITFHDPFIVPDNMGLFSVEAGHCDYHYDIYVTDHIEVTEERFFLDKRSIKIVKKGDLEKRYLFAGEDPEPYASYEEKDEYHSEIYVDQRYLNYMIYDTMFVSLLALERRMDGYHHYVLHSAFMMYHDHAVLFTAPSGTGKSTQASLWEQYRNARVINGDRSLLFKEKETYYAHGWPICGSSEICFNEGYPISCIVVLSQGKENTISELSYKEAFKKILSELTINFHNGDYVNRVMDFIDDLIQHVKVYHLTCNISEDAVKCLEDKMKEDGLWTL